MSIRPELLALFVILIFGIIFLLVFSTGRRQLAEKKHLALTLGYQEVTSRPSQLLSRAESLYQRGEKQGVQIHLAFAKQERDEEFFIFDIGSANDSDTNLGSEVFGVISDRLALPRFSITTLPGFSSDSLLGGLMGGLLDKVLSVAENYTGMSRIEFPNRPDLDDQVLVFGQNEAAVRELLDRIDLGSLTRIKTPLHIAGVDDFLTVDFSQLGSSQSRDQDLVAQHQEFRRILTYFI